MSEENKPTLKSYGDNLVVCENGAILDGAMPDKIISVSDTEKRFVYGDRVFKLTWKYDEATKTKSDIMLEELKE